MKKLLIVLIGMGLVLIIGIRMWIHFFPVEPITVYHLKQDVVTEVAPAPIPSTVKVKSKLKQMEKPKLRPRPKVKPKPIKSFRCDHRKHCSQMRSYEEAVYFNNHCYGTKMDGDDDGIPCERQFGR